MPTISTQTDPCVDVIARLNDEFRETLDENNRLKTELRLWGTEMASEIHECMRYPTPPFWEDSDIKKRGFMQMMVECMWDHAPTYQCAPIPWNERACQLFESLVGEDP